MARIKTKILIPAYMNASRPHEVEAYKTRKDSRFAVARVTDKAWDLRHVKSGMSVGSLLPPRRFTLAELLAVVSAIEAHTELDLTPLDASTFGKGFDKAPPRALLDGLRSAVEVELQRA